MTPPTPAPHPHRPQRLRTTPAMRALVAETTLTPSHLVQPIFLRTGTGVREPIPSMPGQFRFSPDTVAECARALQDAGVGGVLLFGIPESTDGAASGAVDPDGVVARGVRAIRAACTNLVILTDVCLCAYTEDGSCALPEGGRHDRDATLAAYGRMAVVHAEAGADMVAPSGMLDHQVSSIREALDEAGQEMCGICSYAVKYASALYGPFREAAGSAPVGGDRRAQQMDPGNGREAVREACLDVGEGADMVMVKPGWGYLDVVGAVRGAVGVPVACFSVSGEYGMVCAAAARGWLDERAVVLEGLTGMRRAGADVLITYHALSAARWLGETHAP